MDALLTQIVSGLPNVAVAALALYWMSKRMDRQLDLMERLIEQCFEKPASVEQQQPPASR
jgi:hypothetical protein